MHYDFSTNLIQSMQVSLIFLPHKGSQCELGLIFYKEAALRATSHTRLRARDHYTSSTLVGGKGGAGPSSLHTPLEGPTEYVTAR